MAAALAPCTALRHVPSLCCGHALVKNKSVFNSSVAHPHGTCPKAWHSTFFWEKSLGYVLVFLDCVEPVPQCRTIPNEEGLGFGIWAMAWLLVMVGLGLGWGFGLSQGMVSLGELGNLGFVPSILFKWNYVAIVCVTRICFKIT